MGGRAARSASVDLEADLRARIGRAPPDRLGVAVRLIMDHVLALIQELQPGEDDLDAVVQFLTDVGYATDERRQEWVLLADVFGLSAMVADRAALAHPAGTPATLPGPFYRRDAPALPSGADLCRDGAGTPLAVAVAVSDVAGHPVAGASVEVWHANAAGRYENQDPDNQPEHNLRGRFLTDATGAFTFRTIRPGGCALPDDGPVGRLARRLGLPLDRPAHIHLAVTAPRFRRLVTAIFDGRDPAIARDALFAVKPALVADFPMPGEDRMLNIALVLTPADDPASPVAKP